MFFFFFFTSVIVILFLLRNIRFNLTYYILYLLCKKHGYQFLWVYDVNNAKKYLSSNDDKAIIETIFSRKAWHPILSLESENGENYIKLKAKLVSFFKQIPPTQKIVDIINELIIPEHVTSKEISELTIKVFMKYLFDYYYEEDISILYKASIEIRKQIAIKGDCDMYIKQNAIDIISKYINRSKYDVENNIMDISVILQPFIISPAINVSDLAIHWDETTNVDINITNIHPFPILERCALINGKKNLCFHTSF